MWPFKKSKHDESMDILRYRLKNRNDTIEILLREKVELEKKLSKTCPKCKSIMRDVKI